MTSCCASFIPAISNIFKAWARKKQLQPDVGWVVSVACQWWRATLCPHQGKAAKSCACANATSSNPLLLKWNSGTAFSWWGDALGLDNSRKWHPCCYFCFSATAGQRGEKWQGEAAAAWMQLPTAAPHGLEAAPALQLKGGQGARGRSKGGKGPPCPMSMQLFSAHMGTSAGTDFSGSAGWICGSYQPLFWAVPCQPSNSCIKSHLLWLKSIIFLCINCYTEMSKVTTIFSKNNLLFR